ncbi:MAG: OmpA family protein [Sedimenticola sp.]
MNQKKIVALLAPLGLVAGMSVTTAGITAEGNTYAQDVTSSVVRSGYGECWQSAGGAMASLPECGDVVDSDGDGVYDDKDKCPGTPKGVSVDAMGCPLDSDGDGVLDYKDKCPGTRRGAKVDMNGCEIVAAKPAPIGKVVISDVMLFGFDSAVLKDGATSAIDRAYAQFQGNAHVAKVVITGHTDSKGSEAYNQVLSEERAKAVLTYLVNSGANSGMLEARGMGESQPAMSNDTEQMRQFNRRVEFHAIMK